jgi:hypothetical protein
MPSIKIKRGTKAQLDSAASAGNLKQGELYLITDEDRIAVGLSTTTYEAYAIEDHNHDLDYADISHNHTGVYEPADATILKEADIDDTPVDGVTDAPISSNWAYDKVVSDALELQRLNNRSPKNYYPLGQWARVCNLATTDADLKGYAGGFTDGRYGYFVPWDNGSAFGKVARVDLTDFSTVSVLDLTSTDADLKGYIGGFTDGRYGYFVPFDNGSRFGKVARIQITNGGQF